METEALRTLKKKKLFVLDMDGTFYLGNRILDGSLGFIEKLRNTGKRFLFFTNNSSKTPEYYRDKLASMGCGVRAEDVVTSGDVTIDYLRRFHAGKRVFLLAPEKVKESFSRAGIHLDESAPDVVVAAFDTSLTFGAVSAACTFIRNGAVFLATHPDLNCPVENGFLPDCGSICAMITASTGRKPKVLGKPHRETLDAILNAAGCEKEDLAFVGDRLYTDIAIGVRNGVTGILVLTGETTPEMLRKSEIKPDYVFESLSALGQVI